MSELTVFPNVIWKIKDVWVSKHCKRKSPYFNFYDKKLRLKFIYTADLKGCETFQIYMKSSPSDSPMNIKVTSSVSCYGNVYCSKSKALTDSALNEWLIWEESQSNIISIFRDIETCFKESYFVCSITPGSYWKHTDNLHVIDLSSRVTLDSSPCISSLCHDFEKLFNSHVMSDVILISGDQTIYAHRNILSARSDVFAAMFRNDMKEARERSVDMTDMEPAVLEQLLRYMYSGNTPRMSSENVHQLYAAADKYGVDALKMKCAIFMVENPETAVTPDASEVVASKTLDLDLKANVLSHFANVKAVLSTEEWKKLSEGEPKFAHEAFIFFVSKTPC